jgi:hypothetical protein
LAPGSSRTCDHVGSVQNDSSDRKEKMKVGEKEVPQVVCCMWNLARPRRLHNVASQIRSYAPANAMKLQDLDFNAKFQRLTDWSSMFSCTFGPCRHSETQLRTISIRITWETCLSCITVPVAGTLFPSKRSYLSAPSLPSTATGRQFQCFQTTATNKRNHPQSALKRLLHCLFCGHLNPPSSPLPECSITGMLFAVLNLNTSRFGTSFLHSAPPRHYYPDAFSNGILSCSWAPS